MVIPEDVKWGVPTLSHTLHQLHLVPFQSELDHVPFPYPQLPPPRIQRNPKSERIEFLESSRCPLALYMTEYELACCRLIYLISLDKKEEFKRRVPIPCALSDRTSQNSLFELVSNFMITNLSKSQSNSPSDIDQTFAKSGAVQTHSTFMSSVKKFIATPGSRQRLFDIWDITKMEDPNTSKESVAAFDPYLTRNLMWCLRLKRSRTTRPHRSSILDSTVLSSSKALKSRRRQSEKNELNADVLNAWMRLLQRHHDECGTAEG